MHKSHILRMADPIEGGAPPAPKPAAAPVAAPPKPAAAAPSAPPPAAPVADAGGDDPFAPPAKPAAAAPAKPAAAPTAPVVEDFEKLPPKELRDRVKQLRTESQANAEKVKSLEAKIKEYDAKGIDTTALTSRLTAIEKERDAAQAELRAAKQEASPEFKEKYEKPFNQYAERAKGKVEQLQVTDPATQEQRAATWADFAAIYGAKEQTAIEQANALFGASASYVLSIREKLKDLDDARMTALDEEKKHFKERSEREVAEQARDRETVGKTWQETNRRLAETNPDYKDDPEDTEAADARKHALTVFDTEIKAADRADFIQKKIARDAHIRQRVGAFAVQKLKLARLEAKNAALQAQVDELKGSAPGGVRRPGGGAAPAGEEDEVSWGRGLKESVQPE